MSEPKAAAGAAGAVPGDGLGHFITIPAQAREEIGQLAFYIDQMLHHLREVNEHVRGSFEEMPGVLHQLKDIVKMTEVATVRVLEEAEGLLAEGQAATALLAEARRAVAAGDPGGGGVSLEQLQALLNKTGSRAMAIMSALEFQDLTAQKIGQAFSVLEEVGHRLGRIQALVELGQEAAPPPARKPGAGPGPVGDLPSDLNGKAAQALADEILLQFRT